MKNKQIIKEGKKLGELKRINGRWQLVKESILEEVLFKTITGSYERDSKLGWETHDTSVDVYMFPVNDRKEFAAAFDEFDKDNNELIRLGITEDGHIFFWKSSVLHRAAVTKLFGAGAEWAMNLIFKSGSNMMFLSTGYDMKMFFKQLPKEPQWIKAFETLFRTFPKVKYIELEGQQFPIEKFIPISR